MSKKRKAAWYWFGGRDGFERIVFCTNEGYPFNGFGPHRSFARARADALAYYQCDKRDAQAAITDVKAFKKPPKKGGTK